MPADDVGGRGLARGRLRSRRPGTGGRLAGQHLGAQARGGGARVVTAYAAVGSEPPTRPLLEALVERGVRVLLPVVAADGALQWGDLVEWAQLEESASGLLEPAATTGATAAAQSADLGLVPAAAIARPWPPT